MTKQSQSKVITSKFKILLLSEDEKNPTSSFPEDVHVAHTCSFTFDCDLSNYKSQYETALKNQIKLAEPVLNDILSKPNACLHKNVYFCSDACYPDSTMALEYNSNIDPNIIFESKRGVVISKTEFKI